METGKTSKYFKYAIGEIILVVIGILIALQINNWNQNRLNTSVERETLLNLKQDLDSAHVQLKIKIIQNNTYRYNDSVAMTLIHNNFKVSNDSIEKLLLSHIYTPTFDPELGTLNEILSTGKMEIIKNKNLRNHISSWNRYMDELDEVDNRLIYLDDNFKTPLYMQHLPYRNSYNYVIRPNNTKSFINSTTNSNFKTSIEDSFYSLEFENLLSNYLLYGSIQRNRLEDVKQKLRAMTAIIKDELQIND